MHIFDLFLLQGDSAIIRIILNSIEQQRHEILDILCEGQLQLYFRRGMHMDTFNKLKCCGIPHGKRRPAVAELEDVAE